MLSHPKDDMAKVFHLTLVLEIAEEASHPKDWDWSEVMMSMPGVQGLGIVDAEQRPYRRIEDDPVHYTKH